MTTQELYEFADSRSHLVLPWRSAGKEIPSVSVLLRDGSCAIGLDPSLSGRDERWCLAHELGHCETGTFYCRSDPPAYRSWREERATRWAIRAILSYRRLTAAISDGCDTPEALAEQFGVPVSAVFAAIRYYRDALGLDFSPNK